MLSRHTILAAPKVGGGLNRSLSSQPVLLSDTPERERANELVPKSEEQYGDSMPPGLRKLLLPLLMEVVSSAYLIADSIGMWHLGDERFWLPRFEAPLTLAPNEQAARRQFAVGS
jgi:hypothetical protein